VRKKADVVTGALLLMRQVSLAMKMVDDLASQAGRLRSRSISTENEERDQNGGISREPGSNHEHEFAKSGHAEAE